MIGSEPMRSNQSPPPGISEEDWQVTPMAVRVLVTELLRRVADLEARLNQTSRNSHKHRLLIRPGCVLGPRKSRRDGNRVGSLGMRATDGSGNPRGKWIRSLTCARRSVSSAGHYYWERTKPRNAIK